MGSKARFDPEAALRTHFAAELEEERRFRPAAPRAPERGGGPGATSTPRRRRPRALPEAAAAAIILASAGLSALSDGGPLGAAMADTAIRGGRAAVLGAAVGERLGAAVQGFGELKGAASTAPSGRFK